MENKSITIKILQEEFPSAGSPFQYIGGMCWHRKSANNLTHPFSRAYLSHCILSSHLNEL